LSDTIPQPDWRRLFDHIRVPWIDRGKNCKQGNINIKCVWCGDHDPSMHLSIAEAMPAYYCYRNPDHKGHNIVSIITRLGYSYTEARTLLNQFIRIGELPQQTKQSITLDAARAKWEQFRPAIHNPDILDYLYSRGFPEPELVCLRYDLRFMPYGRWSHRVLIPIKENGRILSWTGRAYVPTELRYLTQDVSDNEGFVYAPRGPRRIAVVVEGPLDALKVASATEQLPISPVALTGSNYNDNRIRRLKGFLQLAEWWLFALDRGVSAIQVNKLRIALEIGGKSGYSFLLPLPTAFGDPGEMPVEVIGPWITGFYGGLHGNSNPPPLAANTRKT
jgi:hypothetical protein